MSHSSSLHHLYYSSQADPTTELRRSNNYKSKSYYQLDQLKYNNKFASRCSLAQYGGDVRQEKVQNTYYNNMVCYIDNKNTDTEHNNKMNTVKNTLPRKGGSGTVSVLAKDVRTSHTESCCSCCCVFTMSLCLVLGFVGGVVCGAIIQRHGYLQEVGVIFLPGEYQEYEEYRETQPQWGGEEGGDPRCMVRLGGTNVTTANCAVCSRARLLSVAHASYADCNGLYTMSSLTSIWDSKRVVYQRVAGGLRPQEKRYIYWNAHFYGENFYGWSIGDTKSLVESGPFHSQGRGGVSNQPWQGTWRSNVTVKLTNCNMRRPIRWDQQTMDQLQRMREQERELTLLRGGQRNREGK